MKVLVVFDSVSATKMTAKVAKTVADSMKEQGFEVDCFLYKDVSLAAVKSYDCLIVGSPTMAWKPTKEIMQFLDALETIGRQPRRVHHRALVDRLFLAKRPDLRHAAHRTEHVVGNPNHPRVGPDGGEDAAANPPRRVGAETEAALRVESVHRLDQAHIALLDEIQKIHAGVGVPARDAHDQALVRLHEMLARQHGVDLVEIAATATPPVCRLVNLGKFRYEKAKKDKE